MNQNVLSLSYRISTTYIIKKWRIFYCHIEKIENIVEHLLETHHNAFMKRCHDDFLLCAITPFYKMLNSSWKGAIMSFFPYPKDMITHFHFAFLRVIRRSERRYSTFLFLISACILILITCCRYMYDKHIL